VYAGGEVIARLTCRDMLFCCLLDFGTGCIIAAIWL
jgi:hypothetical protein